MFIVVWEISSSESLIKYYWWSGVNDAEVAVLPCFLKIFSHRVVLFIGRGWLGWLEFVLRWQRGTDFSNAARHHFPQRFSFAKSLYVYSSLNFSFVNRVWKMEVGTMEVVEAPELPRYGILQSRSSFFRATSGVRHNLDILAFYESLSNLIFPWKNTIIYDKIYLWLKV